MTVLRLLGGLGTGKLSSLPSKILKILHTLCSHDLKYEGNASNFQPNQSQSHNQRKNFALVFSQNKLEEGTQAKSFRPQFNIYLRS